MQSPYQSYPDSSLVAETSQWLGEPPAWAQQRRSDYQLDFSKADAAVLQQQQRAAVSFRGLPLNITHQQGYYYGNIAIVRIGSQFYVAVRKLQFYFTLRTALPEYPIDKDPGDAFGSVLALLDFALLYPKISEDQHQYEQTCQLVGFLRALDYCFPSSQ